METTHSYNSTVGVVIIEFYECCSFGWRNKGAACACGLDICNAHNVLGRLLGNMAVSTDSEEFPSLPSSPLPACMDWVEDAMESEAAEAIPPVKSALSHEHASQMLFYFFSATLRPVAEVREGEGCFGGRGGRGGRGGGGGVGRGDAHEAWPTYALKGERYRSLLAKPWQMMMMMMMMMMASTGVGGAHRGESFRPLSSCHSTQPSSSPPPQRCGREHQAHQGGG